MTCPSLDQRSVHREMFIRHVRLGSFQHPLKKRLRDLFVQQTLSILAIHRVIPPRFVPLFAFFSARMSALIDTVRTMGFMEAITVVTFVVTCDQTNTSGYIQPHISHETKVCVCNRMLENAGLTGDS